MTMASFTPSASDALHRLPIFNSFLIRQFPIFAARIQKACSFNQIR
jgi:hypothetical protein